ncbi:MAG: VWA domain-containing protein [Planctomycetes bacterium]|nr:VWA domain-containing protein [Planctomycetota bacterium]
MPTWLIWTLGLGVPLLAAAVPIIIHLINLTRFRKVDWAAMEFLLRAYEKTRRRFQLESLIMLLLRVAAIILIAMALFPMGCERIKDWADDSLGLTRGSLNTDAPLHLILVLDNSGSMSYEQENQTSFDRAKQYALTLVDSLEPNRDRVTIIRTSDVYVPPGLGGAVLTEEDVDKSRRRRVSQLASLNLDAARREISATQVAAVDTNILAAFQEAARIAESTPQNDAVGMVVISDFYAAGWGEVRKDASANPEFVETANRIRTRLEEGGTNLTFYDAGFDNTQNVAISDIRVAERIVGNGMEAGILVDLTYYASSGKAETRSVRLKYRIDGGTEKPFSSTIEMPPGSNRRNIPLTLTARELELKDEELKTGASRNIEIFTEQADALKADNSRNLVIHVVPNIPILVVNGSPHPDPIKDETFYLETALGISSSRAEGDAGGGPTVRITPNRVIAMRAEQLAAVDSFLDYRLVILANVRDLPEGVVNKLTEFVDAGFGLVVFDGDQVDYQKYNSMLYKDGKGLLPAKLGRPGGSDDEATAPLFGLVPKDTDHPVMRIFTETPENVSIITNPKPIRNWRTVELPQGTEVDPLRPTSVLLNIDATSGAQPFMVERPYGRGRVVYVSTTAANTWNEMWTLGDGLPLFLYLELASYLTGNEARYSNLSVGEPYRRVLRITDIAPMYTVRDPNGTTTELVSTAEEGLKLLEYGGTAQPGVYSLTALDRLEGGQTRKRWQERFAVNQEARESDVTKITPVEEANADIAEGDARSKVDAALKEALGFEDFVLVRAGEEIDGDGPLGGDEGNREWMWLAVLGVAFLLFETVWSGVISKPED